MNILLKFQRITKIFMQFLTKICKYLSWYHWNSVTFCGNLSNFEHFQCNLWIKFSIMWVDMIEIVWEIFVLQVITFNIPLTLCLGYYLQYSQYGHKRKSLCHIVRHIYFPFIALVCFQTYIALSEFPAAYGTRALVLGPVRTGSVLLAIILFFIARKTNVNSLVCSHNN